MGNAPFKLKSGNTSSFKLMGSSPVKNAPMYVVKTVAKIGDAYMGRALQRTDAMQEYTHTGPVVSGHRSKKRLITAGKWLWKKFKSVKGKGKK